MIERFAADLEREGTGRAMIVRTLAVLQGVMKRAVRDYNLPSNAVQQVDKPSQRRDREPILVASSRSKRCATGACATAIPAPRR